MTEIESWIERNETKPIYSTLRDLIKEFELNVKSRKQKYAFKRHYFCKFMFDNFKIPKTKIALLINRHHATVINSYKAHENLLKYKPYTIITKEIAEALNSMDRLKIREELRIK